MPEAVAAVPIFLAEAHFGRRWKRRQPSDDSDERSDKFLCDWWCAHGQWLWHFYRVAEQQDIINAINNFYGVSGRVSVLNKLKEDSFAPVIRRVEDSSEDAPIIKIVNSVIVRPLSEIRPVISISNPRRMIRGCVSCWRRFSRNAVTLPKTVTVLLFHASRSWRNGYCRKRLPQDGRINDERVDVILICVFRPCRLFLGERSLCVFLIKRRLLVDINDLAFTAKNMELYSSLFNFFLWHHACKSQVHWCWQSTTLYSTLTNITILIKHHYCWRSGRISYWKASIR